MGRDYGEYDTWSDDPEWSSPRKRSLATKVRDGITVTFDGLACLLPKKKSKESDYYGGYDSPYSPYDDPDYGYGILRKKNRPSPIVIAGRVVLAASVAASTAAAFLNRDKIVYAWQEWLSRPQVTQSASPTTTTDVDIMESIDNTSTPEVVVNYYQEPQPSSPTSSPEPPKSTPSPTPDPPELGTSQSHTLGVTINYDPSQQPISYEVNGQVFNIDQAELARLRASAIEEGLPKLVFVAEPRNGSDTNSGVSTSTFEPSTDRPATTELPADVFSPEQLASMGITIIQGDDVRLHLRAGAFEPDGLLYGYQVGGDRQLTVVLVDGPTVSGAYMTDSKYDSVRDAVGSIDVDIETYRQDQIAHYQDWNIGLQAELTQYRNAGNTDLAAEVEYYMVVNLTKIQALQEASSESLAIAAGMTEFAGLYVYGEHSDTIYIAAGQSGDMVDRGGLQVFMYVDSSGNIQVDNNASLGGRGVSFIPQENQTYPRPSDFIWRGGGSPPSSYPLPRDSSPLPPLELWNVYPFAAQNLSNLTRHEFVHMTNYLFPNPWDPNYWRRSHEWSTDMEAMGTIQAAYQRWVESGFTDNSGYYFVFERADGTIILGNDPVGQSTKH